MPTPFMKYYAEKDVVTRNKVENLFWLSIIVIPGALALTILTYLFSDPVLPYITAGILAVFVAVLLLIRFSMEKAAFFLAFFALLTSGILGALLNRSGFLENDLFQAGAFFILSMVIITAISEHTQYGLITAFVGLGTGIVIILNPFGLDRYNTTIGLLNLRANPGAVLVIYGLSSVVALYNHYQMGWVMKRMKSYHDLTREHSLSLEKQVIARTSSLQDILDNTGQGFLKFGPDLKVEPGYSKGCEVIFNKSILGADVPTLLFSEKSEEVKDFRQGMALYFSGKSKASVIFDLMEKSLYHSGKFLTVDYRETKEGMILCVLTDITAKKLLEEKNLQEAERQRLIFKALNNKHFFAGFMEEAETLFTLLEKFWEKDSSRQEREEVLRQIHTFKGNAGFFGFNDTLEVSQDFEHCIADSLVIYNDVPFRDLTLDLKKSFYRELGRITEIMGKQWLQEAGGVVVPRTAFNQMVKYIRLKLPSEIQLLTEMERLRKIQLRELFSRFIYIAEATAKKLGKRIAPLVLNCEDLRVVPEHLEGLAEKAIHLINNMVDHGIEPFYEREALGKSSEGHLEVNVEVSKSALTIQFKDDGRGIDLDEVVQKAKAQGLIDPQAVLSSQESAALIFNDGFSTKGEVSEVSGRGVGLSAVKNEVTRLGGTINVQTKKGVGTSFELILPLARRKTDQGVQK